MANILCKDRCIVQRLAITCCLAANAAAIASCAAGSGDGLDQDGRPIGDGGSTVSLTAEFGSIQQNVFTPNCAISGCHIGAAAPLGLRPANSFALLVSIPSNEFPGLLRVDPGNPDLSYLIQKLEGTAAVGARMPLNGPPFLPQSTVDVIRQWIVDGALATEMPALAPTVVSVVPTNSNDASSRAADITVIFSSDVDPSVINATTVKLLGSGADGTFGDGNEFIVDVTRMTLAQNNSRVLTISLDLTRLRPDIYGLRLSGSGASAIASMNGVLLDGDADGIAGGDFTSILTINSISYLK